MKDLNNNHAKLVLGAAEKNFALNELRFEELTKKQLYMLAYKQGYQVAYCVFSKDFEGQGCD